MPSTVPTGELTWATPRAFPNLNFTDPMSLVQFPGSNDVLVVERAGIVKRLPKDDNVTAADVTTFLDWTGRTQLHYGDQGLYSLLFHPDFSDPIDPQRFIYICYSHQLVEGTNSPNHYYWRLTRLELDANDAVIPASETILIHLYDPHQWHNGGAMFFDVEGFLWVNNGDGGGGNNPYGNSQALDKSLYGVAIRIDVDQIGGTTSHPIRRQPQEIATLPAGVTPSYTQNYYIPSDNPWVDAVAPVPPAESTYLEEIYACGLRSPHTMTYDPISGQVWIGDVGQSTREEFNLFVVDPLNPVAPGMGPNFGWSTQEGIVGPDLPATAHGLPTLPVHDYGRSVGQCIIGGGVYRGSKFTAQLGGKALFADNRTTRIWSLVYEEGEAPIIEEVTTLSENGTAQLGGPMRGLTRICTDADGEQYFLYAAGPASNPNGKIFALEGVPSSPEPPALLSQTGAFTDTANLVPADFLLPYKTNNPLWSDRSLKSRWIALPNDGTHDTASEQIQFSESGNWNFPAGTVLIKHFELPLDKANSSVTTRLETRFIVCLDGGGKYGVTYRWRPDGSDADLLSTGETADYTISELDGSTTTQTWQFPSRSNCIDCHTAAAGQALGVRTHQLNDIYTYPDSGIVAHQLETWSVLGMLDTQLPADFKDRLRAALLDDETIPIEHRARSYLDSNCAHCHQPGGPGPGFDARLALPLTDQSLINELLEPEVDGRYDLILNDTTDGQIIPGLVSHSAVHFRSAHAQPDTAAMPPIGKYVVDDDAVQLLASWIQSLTQSEFAGDPVRPLLGGPEGTVGGAFPVTVIFDHDVNDFDAADLSIANATITSVTGDGYYYTAYLQPTATPVTVGVPADTLASGNLGSEILSIPFVDNIAPQITSFTGDSGLSVDGAFTINLEFSEEVTGLVLANFSASNASLSGLAGTGSSYSISVQPTAPGYLSVHLAHDGIGDLFGNLLQTGTSAVIDFQPPSDQLLVQASDGSWYYLIDNATPGVHFSYADWDSTDTGLTDTWGSERLYGDAPAQATWSFTNLPPGNYNVFASWNAAPDATAGSATYSGTDGFATATIDQAPGTAASSGIEITDPSTNTISLAGIGSATISDTTLDLSVTTAGSQIYADAIATGPVPDAYQRWLYRHALSGTGAELAADDNGDSMVNLLEFAFNLDPFQPDSPYDPTGPVDPAGPSGAPSLSHSRQTDGSSLLTIQFIRRTGFEELAGMSYTPQLSSDLTTWSDVNPVPADVQVTPLGSGWERAVINVELPAAASGSRHFVRVTVSVPPP